MLSQDLLDKVLTPEHRAEGLYLIETRDYLFLKRGGKVQAVFSVKVATFESIQHEADQQLEWLRSGITFEREAK